MAKIKFLKRGFCVDEKVSFLKNKGLIFSDEEVDKFNLGNIGYFRLSGYLKYFQKNDKNFVENTNFEKVFDLYEFDRELRLITLDGIERVEISLKANINDYMTENFGIFWYLDKKLFLLNTEKKNEIYEKLLLKIKNIKEKSNSIFVKYYFEKYDEENLVSWMLFEEFTIGELSNIFRLLKGKYKQKIADNYGVYQLDLQIWLHLFVNIRNICAHHGRLWNKEYMVKPRIKDRVLGKKFQIHVLNKNRGEEIIPNYYNIAILFNYLLKKINPKLTWINDLEKLFIKYNFVDVEKMGFHKNWKQNFK